MARNFENVNILVFLLIYFLCVACAAKTEICEGDNCNNKNIKQGQRHGYDGIHQKLPLNCYNCIGEECSLGSMLNLRKCESDSFQDCLTVFNTKGAVLRRGCERIVDEEYSSYCKEYPDLCFRCKSNGCNTADTLENYRECFYCDSATNSDCLRNTSVLNVKRKCAEGCLTVGYSRENNKKVIHGLIRRCYEDMELADRENCNEENNCIRCFGELCNTATIAPLFAETKRHSCQHCERDNCDEPEPRYCTNNDSVDDQCYIQFENITHSAIRMGCKSDLSQEELSQGIKDYFICKGDNCNTYENLPPEGICLLCHSLEHENCAAYPTNISMAIGCAHYPFTDCFTRINEDGSTARGCLLDLPVEEFRACKSDTANQSCQICSGNICNYEFYPKDRQQCYRCNSINSSLCETRPSFPQACPIYKQNETCVTKFDKNGVTYRGCGSELNCNDSDRDNCHVCSESNCNTITSYDLLTCFHCADKDCENVTSQKCKNRNVHNQCYISFNNDSSIDGMGCRSDKTDEEVTALIKKKSLLLCNGKDCNTLGSIPTPNVCSVCSSVSDPLCATNPNLVSSVQQCLSTPYTQCYTRISSEGHTLRGCISSLDADSFYNCIMGNDSLCEICNSTRCNGVDVYPSRRLKCHQCNSTNDTKCATGPNNNKVCPIYSSNDSCVTNLRKNVTIRGCASSSVQCDNSNDYYSCRVCTTPACNTANLKELEHVIEPGKWQPLPLTCLSCQGSQQCQNGSVYRSCSRDWPESCITVFSSSGVVVERGCSSAVLATNAEYCDSKPKRCPRCNSPGCNMATSLDDYIECVACDAENADCVLSVQNVSSIRSCYKHCMTALYIREEEPNPSYALARTCLDDMNLDDRLECEAGRKEFCQACNNTSHCNTIAMPPIRLGCNHCKGVDGCQNPLQANCTNYRPHDLCYVLYDRHYSVIGMGCRSEFSNKQADYLFRQGQLHLCEGDNCNKLVPEQTQKCIICDSRTDVNCATNPKKVQSQTECSKLPHAGCYTRVLERGETSRGCISSLYDDEFASCFNGTSATCKHCRGDNCNNEIFPIDRLSCHICNSKDDATCEYDPNNLSVCPKYNVPEACVSFIRNGITWRGCASTVSCDGKNIELCQHCSESGCNSVNLLKLQNESFGKWQDLPLKCFECSGVNCRNASSSDYVSCEKNNRQDCMTVFNDEGHVIRRGCSDSVNAEFLDYCSRRKENCFSCKSNKCNVASSRYEFIDCIYCDSHTNLDCIHQPLSGMHQIRQCQGACMTALYPSDSSNPPRYDLVRTCLNDKEKFDQLRCGSDLDETCQVCYDEKCNTDNFPDNRLSCFSCQDDECEDPNPLSCPLHVANDKCFTMFDEFNSIILMGCLSSFHGQDLEPLIKTKRVFICENEGCNGNVPPAHICVSCSSLADDSCATNALVVGTTNTCTTLPHTSCYTKLTKEGATERGCLTKLSDEEFSNCLLGRDGNCSVCQGDGCNREVFPRDRLQCYTCNSVDDPTCESFPSTMHPCPVVGKEEKCLTVLKDNVTLRGCSSKIYCDHSDRRLCRSCSSTGCNSIDLRNRKDGDYHGVWQDLPLRCFTCEGKDCQKSLGSVATCNIHTNDDCMTIFSNDGKVQRRGCSDYVEAIDDMYCRSNPNRCFRCKSNECNRAWELSDYIDCVYCNSTKDPLCATNPEAGQFDTRTCYKRCMVALKAGEVVRSCLDDKEPYDQKMCQLNDQNTNDKCASCSGQPSCNNFIYPPNRLRCNVCTDSKCDGAEAQYCKVYDEHDFCFALYNQSQVRRMGCASSEKPNDIEAWLSEGRLYRCDGDDCNAITRLPKWNQCVQCNSSSTPECSRNPRAVKTEITCPAPNSDCITAITSVGDTVRGCSSDLSSEKLSDCLKVGGCSTCNGTKCNAEIFPTKRRQCYVCNSQTDPNCSTSPTNIALCVKYNIIERCVIVRSGQNEVERGCLSDVMNSSANNEKIWSFCDTDLCNSNPLKGAASDVVGSRMFVGVMLIFLIILGNVY